MAKIRVTQTRSPIGCPPDQRGTLRALGLHRIRHSVLHEDTGSIRGMVYKVRHLVEVSDAQEGEDG